MRILKVMAVLVAAASLSCSSSGASSPDNRQAEGIEHAQNITRYRGPELEVEVNYWWAENHIGDELMTLRVAIAAGATSSPVKLDNIRVRTPDGREISPMDQAGLHKIYFGKLRMELIQANAWSPPSARFIATRQLCAAWFITPPDNPQPRSNSIHPSRSQVCYGPLIFEVANGIQPGRWTLIVDLEESQPRVPFELQLPESR
jgi:hypothetical protein